MSTQKSVVIVGGGIIGLCCAHYLNQRGHRVTLLERNAEGGDCCSLGNAGMVVPSHFVPLAAPGMVSMGLRMMLNPESPFALKPRLSSELISWAWRFYRAASKKHVANSSPVLRDLGMESRGCFQELADRQGLEFGLVKRGLLMLCKSPHALKEEERLVEISEKLGVPARVLTQTQAAELDPGIRMDIAGAVYFPMDCHLDPAQLMKGLRRKLQADGVKFRWQAQVTGWRVRGRVIDAAVIDQDDISADEFVIAGGAWSPEIVQTLRITLPMQAGKGYSITLKKPKSLPQVCSILTEARIAVTPMGESLRFAGTMEICGLDLSVNRRRVDGIAKNIPEYFPEFRPDDLLGQPVWSGLRPCSPDGLPYIGRFKKYDNLIAATGHAMMGVSLGPATGKIVSEIIGDETPCVDVTRLSPNRY